MEREWTDLTTEELVSALRLRASHKKTQAWNAEHEEEAHIAESDSKFFDAVADRLSR